ncbi:16S rRNA (uracil(1498)-N(3))-methyltransferase [Allostreptomyces psammosilenae]|uniref:Ribosomal RNA small subunit methyltransferase E n=1 Tax=Allostreptomyces psammosilenae TaxID=1892865 RepID=A0A852ZZM0_9ACTN|nr:16S rRNA (uracil(1498)-N(3))-methyltransferase [Allostreptomyces psammosilenae]NYI06670.1 16S rRNA (uracil1498-N3)-methyltransferase [Allostreptomyces psammosilenae]
MTAPVFLLGTGEPTDPDAAATTSPLAAAAPGQHLRLDGPEGRHAVAVRRMRVGEELVLTDGAGRGALAEVSELDGKQALVATVLEVLDEPEPRPRITVVQALPKGDRGELAVETMTEVGVDAIVPWQASRCVTQWKGERGAKSLLKWRATAREAAKQARRLRFPAVHQPMSTAAVTRLLAEAAWPVVLHEEGTAPLAGPAAPAVPTTGEIVLVVGPEGGVAPEELAAFAEAGATPRRLGRTVLRTSTAGTAAAAVLLAASGRWSSPDA